MADKSQLSADEIASEIESLRSQMRSFALQRAEGLIDANLQRDLVKDLNSRIVALEKLQNTEGDSSTNSNHAEEKLIDDLATLGETQEQTEVALVIEPSDEVEHGEAKVIDELFDKGDTFELRQLDSDDEVSDEVESVPKVIPVSEASTVVKHAESQVIDELFDKGDTFELRQVDSDDEVSDEVDSEPKVVPISEASTVVKHAESQVIDELFDKGDTFELRQVDSDDEVLSKADGSQKDTPSNENEQSTNEPDTSEADKDKQPTDESKDTSTSDEDELAEAHKVQEMTTVGSTDAEIDEDKTDVEEKSQVESVKEATEDSDKSQNFDDLVIEEEYDPLHGDDTDSLTLGDFGADVVVSSAMVKEPDYLDSIEPSRNSIHEPNVVDIREITKTYQMGELELEVLKGVTLQINQGELIAIMGPSGSGKSTLMNILGALDKPSGGEYFLDGVDVSKMKEKQLAEIRNQKIGFVFQSFNLLKRTTAIRQVELPLIYGSHKDRTRLAREALEAVGLGQRLDHTPAELSGGQQQRVAIARALVTKPSLILADEPTGNLDSRSGTEVMQIFQSLNRKNKITTILVTHDVWIARHTDRVIMLRDGKVIADHHVKNPLVAGEAERPTETQELQAIFETTYYEGDEEEYT